MKKIFLLFALMLAFVMNSIAVLPNKDQLLQKCHFQNESKKADFAKTLDDLYRDIDEKEKLVNEYEINLNLLQHGCSLVFEEKVDLKELSVFVKYLETHMQILYGNAITKVNIREYIGTRKYAFDAIESSLKLDLHNEQDQKVKKDLNEIIECYREENKKHINIANVLWEIKKIFKEHGLDIDMLHATEQDVIDLVIKIGEKKFDKEEDRINLKEQVEKISEENKKHDKTREATAANNEKPTDSARRKNPTQEVTGPSCVEELNSSSDDETEQNKNEIKRKQVEQNIEWTTQFANFVSSTWNTMVNYIIDIFSWIYQSIWQFFENSEKI